MNSIARNALLALCFPAAFLAAGYLNAWAALNACAEEVYQQDRGRSGFGMRGRKVPLRREDVTAHIKGPFQVEARYSLPTGIHASWNMRTYLVFGSYRRLLDSNEIHLVRADLPDAPATATSNARGRIASSFPASS